MYSAVILKVSERERKELKETGELFKMICVTCFTWKWFWYGDEGILNGAD